MIRNDREYRNFSLLKRKQSEGSEPDYKVRGYASTFDPYLLWSDGQTEVYEKIDATAFDEADMSDVIFLYNHEGMVYARQKNGTLQLSTDDHGLLAEADLSSTQASREMYNAIQSGLVDQMSFAFTVEDEEFDRETNTRIIHRIGKVYDVSAVSIPANPGTDIAAVSARSYFDGVVEAAKAERLRREKAQALETAFKEFMEVINER